MLNVKIIPCHTRVSLFYVVCVFSRWRFTIGRQSGGGEGPSQDHIYLASFSGSARRWQILVPPCWRAVGMSRGSGAPQYLKSWWATASWTLPGLATQSARLCLQSLLMTTFALSCWVVCVGMSFGALSVCVLIAQLSQLTGIGKENFLENSSLNSKLLKVNVNSRNLFQLQELVEES